MGKGTRYNDEFKQEAVNQVVLHGYSVADVSQRLGISNKSLYAWIKIFSKPKRQRDDEADLRTENARLKRELKRAQEETFSATLDDFDVTNFFVIDPNSYSDLNATFTLGEGSALQQGKNVLLTSVVGVVPDTNPIATAKDRITLPSIP